MEEVVLNLVLKCFHKKSFPPLFLAFAANTKLSGLQSKLRKPGFIFESLSEELNLPSDTLILETLSIVKQENELDFKEKPQQIAPNGGTKHAPGNV